MVPIAEDEGGEGEEENENGVDWGGGESEDEAKKTAKQEIKEEVIIEREEFDPAKRGIRPVGTLVDSICPSCGDARARGLMVCASCGHSYGQANERAKEGAKEIKQRTELEIVYIRRGGRSFKASVRRKYRSYLKSANKKGYATVCQRFAEDPVFHVQMEEAGWNAVTIQEIDDGAAEVNQEGKRTSAQIYRTGRYVYRGKSFAAEDEKWDKAYQYGFDQISEYKHWQRAKKYRGEGVPCPTSSWSSSSSWWHR